MDLIIEYRDCFIPTIEEDPKNAEADELDAKVFAEAHKRLEEMALSSWEDLTLLKRRKLEGNAIEDDKDNFLIPAPIVRLKNKKKISKSVLCRKSSLNFPPPKATHSSRRRTKNKSSILNEEEYLQPPKVTRSSNRKTKNKSLILNEEESLLPPKVARTSHRRTKNKSLILNEEESLLPPKVARTSHRRTKNKSSILNEEENILPPKITRSSHRLTKNKSSILNNGESLHARKTRSKAEIIAVKSNFDLDVDEILKPKRMTRNRKKDISSCSFTINENVEDIISPKRVNQNQAKGNSVTSSSDVELDDDVKPKRASRCKIENAFMNISVNVENGEIKGKKSIADAAFNICDLVDISSVHTSIKKSKRLNNEKTKDVAKEISITEGNKSPEELQDKVAIKTNAVNIETKKNNKLLKEVEADDEWVSDEEDEVKEKSSMQCNPLFSSTPKKPRVASKVVDEAVSTYKSLRNRRVKKPSTDVLGPRSKTSSNKANLLPILTSTRELKTNGIQVKEDELKKMIEKETEALKRKEELMKKRAETAKRKREEKMAKVKRTREEVEVENKTTMKLKKEKLPVAKKPSVSDVELKSILSPVVKAGTTKPNLNVSFDMGANATFEVKGTEKENDVYNMTPCWQDVSPVQPDNPNDYGMVEKSDCSSDEENDPRKKIPTWAEIPPNDPRLFAQCVLQQEIVNEFWGIQPRQPTIKEFFGTKVSYNTLRRGLRYRTSSAIWNTPPLTSLKN